MKHTTEKTLKWGLGLALAVGVMLYFALRYPYHIRFHEQCQLLPLTWSYFFKAVAVPGGLADWCGEFLVQFFLFPWVGAAIMALLVAGIQALSSKLVSRVAGEGMWPAAFAAGFVPAALVWVFLVTDLAVVGGALALLMSLGAALVLLRTQDWVKLIALPLAYWLLGPLAIVCVVAVISEKLVHERLDRRFALFAAACVLLSVACPLLAYPLVPYSFASCWGGIHYTRTLVPEAWHLLAAAWSICLILIAFALWLRLKPKRLGSGRFVALLSAVVLACVSALLLVQGLKKNENMMVENIVHLDCLCLESDYYGILGECAVHVPNIPITMAYRNLALAMNDKLLDDLFKMPQNGLQGLFPSSEGGYFAYLATGEAYLRIGYASMAHLCFFEAQESLSDYRKSVRCYRAMAGTNVVMGYYDGARKYLDALSKTLFHASWARDMERLLSDKAVMEDPFYGQLRQRMPHNFDMLFNSENITQSLAMMCMENPYNRVGVQYLLAFPLVACDMDTFFKFYSAINFKSAPAACSEAAAMNPELARKVGVGEETLKRMREFNADGAARKSLSYMKSKYGTTYWYYYSLMQSRKNTK